MPCLNSSQINSIYLPRRDGKLSLPKRLVTYRDGLPVCWQSPIQLLTRTGVEQLFWSDTTRYRYATPPLLSKSASSERHIFFTRFRDDVSNGDVTALSVDHLNLCFGRTLDWHANCSRSSFTSIDVKLVCTHNTMSRQCCGLEAEIFGLGFGLNLGLMAFGLSATEMASWPQNFTAYMALVNIDNQAIGVVYFFWFWRSAQYVVFNFL